MDPAVKNIIECYNMQPHPEGGYYKETYRSQEVVDQKALPQRFSGQRQFSTAIYFLLERGNFSAFHRIKSDECWHFYEGETLLIYVIDEHANLLVIKLGNNVLKGETFQYVVPAGCWFASVPAEGSTFSFVGCTVSPGFDFADFELAEKEALINEYPRYKDVIEKLTR